MAKAVKLADIAERVGVSTVTVSKALSGQKGVSEEDPQHCGGTGLSAAVSGKKKSEPEELQYRYSDL